MPSKKDIIEGLVKKLQKSYGETTVGFADELMSPIGRWPTGILSLDYVLGGGIPKGRVIQFRGAESSGKSSSAIICAASVVRQGGSVAWVKGEDFDRMWARKLGLNLPPSKEEADIADALEETYGPPLLPHQVVFFEAPSGNVMLEASLRSLRSGAFELIVIDSISSLTPDVMLDKTMDESEGRMHKPAMNTRWTERVYSAFALHFDPETGEPSTSKGSIRNNCSIIVVNQLRDTISTAIALPPAPKGGWCLKYLQRADIKFASHTIIAKVDEEEEEAPKSKKAKKAKGKPSAAEKKKLQTIGAQIDITAVDSQICPRGRTSSFNLYIRSWGGRYRAGMVDHYSDIVTLGSILGIITFAGGWYQYNGKKWHGKEDLITWMEDNPEEVKELESAIRAQF